MTELEKCKLSRLYWEGDKNEEGFFVYLENFGSMVRSTASGYHLDGMLDFKLRQASITKGSGPSCLFMELLHQLRLKPMFQVLEVQQLRGPDLSEAGAAADSASVNATVASAAVGSVHIGHTFRCLQ